jgi:hypothetical protein
MLQQVNLYEPIFREDHKLFSAITICVGLGAVAAGLAAITTFYWMHVVSLDRQLRDVHAQESAQDKLIAEAKGVVEQAGSQQTIDDHLKAMAIELGRRQQALRYLRGGDPGGDGTVHANRGFVGRMTALARQQLDGVWLTGATFVSGSEGFELTGAAMSGALVPIYLGRLTNEPAIAGTRLQTIEIRQPKKPNGAQVEFVVSSVASLDAAELAPKPVAAAKAQP